MIHLKTNEEIQTMQKGGEILKKTVYELRKLIKPGITTKEIDDYAEKSIKKLGGQSSFKKVKDYNWTTCLPINEEVVHTPPSKRILQNGDILTFDIGVYFRGFHTDFSDTVVVGEQADEKTRKFLQTGKDALAKAIKQFKKGNRLGDISLAIEKEITGHGYFVVKQLTGHGIGRSLHEDPYVLGYLDRPVNQTQLIKPGLAVAIEVIYSMGTEDITYDDKESWIIKTKDNSISACFEKTLAICNEDTLILT